MDDAEDDAIEVPGDFDDFDLPPTPDVSDESDVEEDDEAETDDEVVADGDEAPTTPALDLVVKDLRAGPGEILVLPPSECITSPFLDCNEIARILAVRAEQISRRNDLFLPEGEVRCSHNPVQLAKQELRAGMCPLILQRRRAPNVVEEWPVRDLLLLVPI